MTLALILSALTQSPAVITIDARRQTPISPYIYGINFPDNRITDWLKEWESYHDGFTLARLGGNRFTAYNWETNASNAGHDYYNENDDYLAPSDEPGWTVREFLKGVQTTGAAALVTVPTLGYVSADKETNMFGNKDVIKTPDYLNVRFHRSYANKPGGKLSLAPDTKDKAVYQDEFVAWVEKVKSTKSPVWFSLDNEPDWWAHTHSRLETKPTTYDRILSNHTEYARMIKAVAPGTMVFGPANYGWQGMKSFQDAPDANGRHFVDTYLDAMREASRKAGHRLLDVYDFHWYPEATGDGARIIYGSGPEKAGTAAARIQAPRSMWDPTYIEKSWIPASLGNKPIRLLPMMQERIAKHFPGTKLAITEYEFGQRNTISGALAQADALGVFGRYGLFAACHWGLNHNEEPTFAAFQAFIDFDRKGSRFGDRELAVTGETPEENSVYAALDSKDPRRMTIVVINKSSRSMPLTLNLAGFRGSRVRSYVVREGVYTTPGEGNVQLSASGMQLTAPPLSIVTTEIRR